MSRLTIAHLTCGCRVVLRHGIPARWDPCDGGGEVHAGMTRLEWWRANEHNATIHTADERQRCDEERCRKTWETMQAERLGRDTDEREPAVPFLLREPRQGELFEGDVETERPLAAERATA